MGQIFPIDIVAPGALGLNTENESRLLPPSYATTATNCVINRAGRIAARKGWTDQTTTGISGSHTIDRVFEYLNAAGTSVIITTANNVVYKNITDFSDVANDITSSTAPTADYWQFRNFNGKVIGMQRSHAPIEWSGSGDFTDVSYTGTGPDGNCFAAAFGRIWGADADLQTVRYSVLLDDTDFSGAGSGTLDMSSVWSQGMDEITAIESIGANLVIFGRNHIIMLADRSGSEIGLDPSQMEVVDVIEGTGCIARDSVAITGEGDLIFLSRHGLQSLGRVIESKSNPTITLTKKVRADFLADVDLTVASDANCDNIVAVAHPEEGLYIINMPTASKQWVLDLQHPYEDEDGDVLFPVTVWTLGGTIGGLCSTTGGVLYLGSSGVVGKYTGTTDDGSSYLFDFMTGWLDFGDSEINHRLKMLKEIVGSVQVGTADVTWKWEWDFSGSNQTRAFAYSNGTIAEYNVAEYNSAEYAGGLVISRKNLPAYGEGQFLRVGAACAIDGFAFALQHISLAPKIGRMVT